MNFKSALIAAALTVTSIASLAVSPGNLGVIDNKTTDIGNSFAATMKGQTFSDDYLFSIVNPGDAFGSVTFSSRGSFTLSNVLVSLTGTGITGSAADTDPSADFGFNGLSAGNYVLNVTGKITGNLGGSYGGVLEAATAPVPEPETYALMLAGLGAVGFMARRRRPL